MKRPHHIALYTIAAITLNVHSVSAQDTLPSTADPSRITPLKTPNMRTPPLPRITQDTRTHTQAPDEASQIMFTLEQVKVEGVSVFSDNNITALYTDYIGTEIPLSRAWDIATQITRLYTDNGYFLSRAYVPAQEIENGIIVLRVVEGHITDIDIDDYDFSNTRVVKNLINTLQHDKPLRAQELEAFMLQMNALPGATFRAVLEPIPHAEDGSTRLSLHKKDQDRTASISIDNYGSRFLGPYQATATYQDEIIPLQQTTLSTLLSAPTDELQYGSIRQDIPLFPDISMHLSGSYVRAQPGASLTANNIQSNSTSLGIGVSWQPIRQRMENLITHIELASKNTSGDILNNTPLTRDRIRILRSKVSYDTNDTWNGYNYLSLKMNQGLGILGASKKGDQNLSRSEARPDFTTIQADYTRLQSINADFVAIGQISGQYSSAQLFSSEEFGYGGQSFGRAYDPSEITGDHGIAGSVELRYQGLNAWQNISLTPYGFYDIGKVWNKDTGSSPESAASAGMGLRAHHSSGFAANIGIATPLTRNISEPLYGHEKNPRLLLQISYGL